MCSVRPFIFEDLVVADELEGVDPNSLDANQRVEQLCTARINAAISKATAATAKAIAERQMKKECDGRTFTPPAEPLIRLRIDLSGGFESFSGLRFGQKFVGRVANPKVRFRLEKNTTFKHQVAISHHTNTLMFISRIWLFSIESVTVRLK